MIKLTQKQKEWLRDLDSLICSDASIALMEEYLYDFGKHFKGCLWSYGPEDPSAPKDLLTLVSSVLVDIDGEEKKPLYKIYISYKGNTDYYPSEDEEVYIEHIEIGVPIKYWE